MALALPVFGRRATAAKCVAALASLSWRVPVMFVVSSRWMTELGVMRI